MQDLPDFRRVTDASRNAADALRLRQLADLIPRGYGCGDAMDKALEEINDLRGRLALARKKGKALGEAYAEHVSFMHEERRILQSLGLTANLFRKDAQ